MTGIDRVITPADVKALAPRELPELARNLRRAVVESVSRTGGHLGSNLGVVELTIALHRVFDSPHTPLVFDTGHQAYVHKLLTGRSDDFVSLRRSGGLSGYPSRAESVHDVMGNSHASTALSYADGLSRAKRHWGQDGSVVAVVGDGTLTGGLAWEALNNLGACERPVIIVLNDNGRSYAPTVGGLPHHLSRLSDRRGYADVIARLGDGNTHATGSSDGEPATVFASMGLDYLGPVDGHDIGAVEMALRAAIELRRPVVVHCLTIKGCGYPPAEQDEFDRLHAVGPIEVTTGHPTTPSGPTWTDAFGSVLATVGAHCPNVVALSAAMVRPTGLGEFADRFPDRCFDTGIAEQHAVTSASGMAIGGLHPVVAVYSTFLGRAFDQTLLDVALHRLPVTFVLDRAGVTGPDGASHHGMWDLALLGVVPNMRVAAPRDVARLAEQFIESVLHTDGPTAVRFPKAAIGGAIPAEERWNGIDLVRRPPHPDVLIVAVGPLVAAAVAAADILARQGLRCTVADPRWLFPVPTALAELSRSHRLVVTVEDGVRVGGFGSRVLQLLSDASVDTPAVVLGLPPEFLPHGQRSAILRSCGLDAEGIVAAVRDHEERTGRPSSTRQLHVVAAAGDGGPERGGW